MKKGFIFSMTAIFFVLLVIIFLSLYVNIYRKPIYKENIVSYENNIYKFLTGESSIAATPNSWCSVHIIYDLDTTLTQSNIIKKEYCKDYGSKRFV